MFPTIKLNIERWNPKTQNVTWDFPSDKMEKMKAAGKAK